MLLKCCLNCRYHEITDELGEGTSRCSKENCYCRYTKCIAQKALNRFLKDESSRENRPFSALTKTARMPRSVNRE
jgi:hypothetical protein